MKKSLITLLFSLSILSCSSQIAKNTDAALKQQSTFMEENDLWKDDALWADNGMTEEKFNEIIDSIEKIYAPIIEGHGARLTIERNYSDSTVNAYAYQEGDQWVVAMFGGLARRPEVTEDGFAMVVCHELGHHLGGFPMSGWASIEGQSDIFALHACARNLWGNQDNSAYEIQVDAYAKQLCQKHFSQQSELDLCYRQMNASWSLASLLASLNNTKIDFQNPDKTIVKRTMSSHPKAQCRLDSYVAATLCSKKWDDSVMPRDEKYYCWDSAKSQSYDIKARPRCWFKPAN